MGSGLIWENFRWRREMSWIWPIQWTWIRGGEFVFKIED